MAVPQPLDLTGSEESPLDSHVGQQLRIAFGNADPLAENLGRSLRRRWYLGYSAVAGINMFHVKHPSRSVPAVDARPNYMGVVRCWLSRPRRRRGALARRLRSRYEPR